MTNGKSWETTNGKLWGIENVSNLNPEPLGEETAKRRPGDEPPVRGDCVDTPHATLERRRNRPLPSLPRLPRRQRLLRSAEIWMATNPFTRKCVLAYVKGASA